MKKIGIVTFHRSYSYGACLQTYATYKYLENLNNYVEVIDYLNDYEQRNHKLLFKENNRLIGYVKSLMKNIIYQKKIHMDRIFNKPEYYYKITSKQYKRKEEMMNLEYDILVAGSDQIWNPERTNGIDDIYLLNFGKAQNKVSIASSVGSYYFTEDQHEIFQKTFLKFNRISVRESFAKEQLQKDTIKDIEIILDPTFLLSEKEWNENMIQKSKYYDLDEKYILAFFVGFDSQYSRQVKEYADYLQLPVWVIQPIKRKKIYSDKILVDIQIEDFLCLIKNAALVITDSFHGVALSIILHSNFVALTNVTNPIRVASLLHNLHMEERIDMDVENYSSTNYLQTDMYLQPLIKKTKSWITSAINYD